MYQWPKMPIKLVTLVQMADKNKKILQKTQNNFDKFVRMEKVLFL